METDIDTNKVDETYVTATIHLSRKEMGFFKSNFGFDKLFLQGERGLSEDLQIYSKHWI